MIAFFLSSFKISHSWFRTVLQKEIYSVFMKARPQPISQETHMGTAGLDSLRKCGLEYRSSILRMEAVCTKIPYKGLCAELNVMISTFLSRIWLQIAFNTFHFCIDRGTIVQTQLKNCRYLSNLMDPNLRICELWDAQLTSCTLFERSFTPYITHRFFCQLGSWFLSINLVSKTGEARKRQIQHFTLRDLPKD